MTQGRGHQRGQQRGHQGHEGHEGHEGHRKGSDGRSRDGRRLDRNTHHHISGRDVRYVGYAREVYFEGWWFGCSVWPEWVFEEDVYFEMGPNDIWFGYGYNNPGLRVQVVVVD